MPAQHYCVFDTAIGPCGIAWNERGLTRLQLPGASLEATEKRLQALPATPERPPPQIAEAIGEIRRYMRGERVDFAGIPLDLAHVGDFRRAVYDVARAIRWGETLSYGEIAKRAGSPGAAREVGQAMATNPVPIIIPCHRVLASGGRMGGFSAPGGTRTKERLLSLEGVQVGPPRLPGF